MGEDRWPVEEWWSSHDHHMFPYKVPPAAGTAGGSYSQQSSGHWWYQNTQAPLHIPQPVSRGTGMSRQVKDAKPRGRMSAYAFFVQVCREEHKTKHPEEHVVFAEFSKKCAERWKTMTDLEKKRFHDMADKDKERFQNEMKDYVPPEHERKKKKRKQMKDPNAPKRPLSAFFLFSNVERHKIKEIHPAYKAGDTSKELGRRWSAADPSVKSKYQALADQEKVRYDREMTEYKQKGTFSRVDMSGDGDVKKEESGGDDLEDDDE